MSTVLGTSSCSSKKIKLDNKKTSTGFMKPKLLPMRSNVDSYCLLSRDGYVHVQPFPKFQQLFLIPSTTLKFHSKLPDENWQNLTKADFFLTMLS